jgi:hypothetical protein
MATLEHDMTIGKFERAQFNRTLARDYSLNKHYTETMKDYSITITPNGVGLAYLEQLGSYLMRVAQETRRSYSSGKYQLAQDWVKTANDAAYQLDLPQIKIDFDFIEKVRNENKKIK